MQYFALIRFFYKKDPETLDADTVAKLIAELEFLAKTKIINVKFE